MTTNPPAYTPRYGSLAERALEYFRRNPDEELTPADMALKFSVEYRTVAQGLRPALEAGMLAKARAGRQVVYRLPDLLTESGAA